VQFRFLKLVPDSGTRGSEGPAQRDIVDCRRARASAEVAKALALRSGDMVLQVRRVLSFAGTPTILEDIWLPAAPFKGLTAERLANYQGPMYALFETEFHVRMVRAEEKIRAISANDTHASLLMVSKGTPLLSVDRLAYTYQDEPMELRRGYYLTDTHHYHNDMN
jgi:GntR family transcriptional regulator